jgi:SAM-dependent methyltransferase
MPRLKDKQDAYGHEISDYLKGNLHAYEVVEREDGYVDISYGPKGYLAEYKDWPPWQRKGIRFARGEVLDIGCGAGRCLLYLQQKGLDVTGIDISPLAIKVCKQRGVKKALVKSITEIGPDLGIFDTIIMYGNNFGLFGSYKRAKWLLRKMHKMTTDKGRIIAESLDPYTTDYPEHLAYHKYNRRRGRMGGQIRLRIRYKKYASPYFDYLLVSKDELNDILNGTGWKAVRFFDSKFGAYVMVLEKE